MLREIKMPEKTRWVASMACKYALVLLGAVLYTLLVARGAEAKAARKSVFSFSFPPMKDLLWILFGANAKYDLSNSPSFFVP